MRLFVLRIINVNSFLLVTVFHMFSPITMVNGKFLINNGIGNQTIGSTVRYFHISVLLQHNSFYYKTTILTFMLQVLIFIGAHMIVLFLLIGGA